VGHVTPPTGWPLRHGPRAIASSVGHAWFCASCPPRLVLMGRGEIGPFASFYFSNFSDLFQIITDFKNLHMIHLTLENYETNFVG
jgi:hypothetical protein